MGEGKERPAMDEHGSLPAAQFTIAAMTTEQPQVSPDSSVAQRIRIVLVGTQHPGNIGSAARAMKTMGLDRLVLVAPQRAPDVESFALAAGANDVLDTAVTFNTLADAVSDCRLVLGCTARSRRISLQELMPRAGAERAVAVAAEAEVALVFGRERTGLENHELQLCHAAIHIPANPDYSSLNLAAAVQVISYEMRLALLASPEAGSPTLAIPAQHNPPASHAQMEHFFAQLAETLDAIDFHKGRSPDSAMRKLRRLFLRVDLEDRELRLLRGILADASRMAMLAGQR
ncbi:tRNA:Cm32/Um32 methyltransferase [Lysobacter sp. A03]|nr:tRNA:Cm32/Um32 methyltransferase [Lysobacter sp. A03]